MSRRFAGVERITEKEGRPYQDVELLGVLDQLWHGKKRKEKKEKEKEKEKEISRAVIE
jgi:hypothetical protein